MKERSPEQNSEMMLCTNDKIPQGKYVITESPRSLAPGEEIDIKETLPVYASPDNHDADWLFGVDGETKRRMRQGKHMLFICNPLDKEYYTQRLLQSFGYKE